jgi:hypothetical protein
MLLDCHLFVSVRPAGLKLRPNRQADEDDNQRGNHREHPPDPPSFPFLVPPLDGVVIHPQHSRQQFQERVALAVLPFPSIRRNRLGPLLAELPIASQLECVASVSVRTDKNLSHRGRGVGEID